MNTANCTCSPDTIRPSQHFYVNGRVHIFIVLNMRNFILQNCRNDFERLRGGRAFAKAIKFLKPENYFVEDEYETETVNRGHEFQVFRGHLEDDWFNTTYLLENDKTPPPKDYSLAKDWKNFELRIRVSRTGFLEIRLTKRTPRQGENIIKILREQMEMGSRGYPDTDPQSTQLKLALYCADLFISSIQNTIDVFETKETMPTQICTSKIGADPPTLPYRQRHMVLFINELICSNCTKRITAEKLWNDYGTTLAAILEGALIKNAANEMELPEMDEKGKEKFDNLASWKDELCIFAPERSLIYIPEKRIYLSGQIGTDPVNYEHYWECINRGIEHTVAVRAALQIIEYNTTRDLDDVPRLTQKVVDGDVNEDDKKEISQMAQAISNTFNMLPLLRDVLVPSSSYRASYAVNKFDKLNSVLHLEDIKDHVERNVDELVSFVQFFSSMEVQDELSKNDTTINSVGIVIALVALAVAGPSFLADYHEFAINTYHQAEWTQWVFLGFIGLVTLGLVLWLFFMRLKKRQQKRRLGNLFSNIIKKTL